MKQTKIQPPIQVMDQKDQLNMSEQPPMKQLHQMGEVSMFGQKS